MSNESHCDMTVIVTLFGIRTSGCGGACKSSFSQDAKFNYKS